MASEDEYVSKLIELVRKYPVLYEVDLIDYKNKNKKGEAFKQVQKELKEAGCSEFQAQCTYKKWISLKRKFRVEYFRLKMEEETKGVANATSNFRFYNNLTFLIPYCKYYKSLKSTSKRKCVDDDEESDEERFNNLQYNDVDNNFNTLLSLDQFLNTKRIKYEDGKVDSQLFLKQLQNEHINNQFSRENQSKILSNTLLEDQSLRNQCNEDNASPTDFEKIINTNDILLNNNDSEPSTSDGINKIIDEKQIKKANFESNSPNGVSNKTLQKLSNTLTPLATTIDPLSVLTQREILNFQKKCHSILTQAPTSQTLVQHDLNTLAPNVYNDEASPSALETFTKESENALFGRLVASELDKIPENMHNLVRAQVLLLLAHATSNTNNNMFNAVNKLFSGSFHM